MSGNGMRTCVECQTVFSASSDQCPSCGSHRIKDGAPPVDKHNPMYQ